MNGGYFTDADIGQLRRLRRLLRPGVLPPAEYQCLQGWVLGALPLPLIPVEEYISYLEDLAAPLY